MGEPPYTAPGTAILAALSAAESNRNPIPASVLDAAAAGANNIAELLSLHLAAAALGCMRLCYCCGAVAGYAATLSLQPSLVEAEPKLVLACS